MPFSRIFKIVFIPLLKFPRLMVDLIKKRRIPLKNLLFLQY